VAQSYGIGVRRVACRLILACAHGNGFSGVARSGVVTFLYRPEKPLPVISRGVPLILLRFQISAA